MTYLDEIAAAIRNAVEPSTLLPDDSYELFLSYAVLLRAKGAAVTLSDVHDAWAAWMVVRDPSHEALVSFDELSVETRNEDRPFWSAIRLVADPGEA